MLTEAQKMVRKAYYRSHKAQHRETARRWQRQNRDKANASVKKWRAANPDKVKAMKRRHHQRHGDTIKAYQRAYRLEYRNKVFAAYGGRCACCGEANSWFLTVDHIGGLAPEAALVGRKLNAWTLYKYLVDNDFPNRGAYRLLCYNCNCAVGLWGVCPHKREPYLR